MFDRELEEFKTRIDLRQYAAAHGYHRDARESWTGSDVMRHPVTHDKICVKFGTKRAPHHWGYYSFRNDGDHGSIIDFAKRRLNLSLGAIRKELRPWIGEPPVPVPAFPSALKTIKDHRSIELRYAEMAIAHRHPYLENERAIPPALLASDRFAGCIRIDARGNAIFPHVKSGVLCGFEIKNKGFTGFAAGGEKGLWSSNERPDDRALVFGESGIDMLSHAVLYPDDRTRYKSLGGKLNPRQPGLILEVIVAMPANADIIAGMDADEAGRELAEAVRRAFESSGRSDLRFAQREPVGFKDWNDQLREKQPDFFPSARVSGLNMK